MKMFRKYTLLMNPKRKQKITDPSQIVVLHTKLRSEFSDDFYQRFLLDILKSHDLMTCEHKLDCRKNNKEEHEDSHHRLQRKFKFSTQHPKMTAWQHCLYTMVRPRDDDDIYAWTPIDKMFESW